MFRNIGNKSKRELFLKRNRLHENSLKRLCLRLLDWFDMLYGSQRLWKTWGFWNFKISLRKRVCLGDEKSYLEGVQS